MGIDVQAVSPSPDQTYYGLPPDLRSKPHGWLTTTSPEIIGKHPTASPGWARCRSRRRSWPVAELERLHKSLGLKGIEIAGSVQGEDYSDPKFRPIFASSRELGLLMFMHRPGLPTPTAWARGIWGI